MSNWRMPDGTYIANPMGSDIVYSYGDIRNYTKPKPYTYEEALGIWQILKGYSEDPNFIFEDERGYYY